MESAMISLLAIFAASLTCSLVLTPVVRSLARRYGLVDRPDGRRKLQAKAIPLGGGLAILLSAMVAVGTAVFYPLLRDQSWRRPRWRSAWASRPSSSPPSG